MCIQNKTTKMNEMGGVFRQTLICIKLAPASLATALAISVLPQPGGP